MSTTATPCECGCVQLRKHTAACDDGKCRGCEPRPAEFGLLCYGCHTRLLNLLHNAAGQFALLLAVVERSGQADLTQQTLARFPGPRVDSGTPLYMPTATRTFSAEASEPLRVAAFDTARQLSDMLSGWVEMLVEQHDLSGPPALLSADQAREGRHGRWRMSRWPLAEDEYPELVWTDPPAQFEIRSATRWLVAQIARLECCPGIGDLWSELGEVMSQAHALAPWREQVTTLRGIECPECHRHTLKHFGGDEDVTCTTCKASIPWSRYAIWVRELQQRKAAS